ncbi:MAG: hypothetical protein MSC53_03980 [Arcanobacterium sp.]|nr:hypothetical protein [Arcanobacterium sp.]
MKQNLVAYGFRVVKNASFKKFSTVLDEVHQRSGIPKPELTKDMVKSFLKYGAGYYDYSNFNFFELTDAQRDTYMTRFRSKKLITKVNDPNYALVFDSKSLFNEVFRDFIRRDFLKVDSADDEECERFFNAHDEYFAKMDGLEAGAGAELLKKENFADAAQFTAYIRGKKFGVVEQVLKNHPDLAAVYNGSLNTMRMITLIDDSGEPHLLFAAQKFGISGRFVDVYGAHGPVDLETGEFLYPARHGVITDGIEYSEHPDTGVLLVGFHTPLFQEAKEFVLRAAKVVPQMRYVGWDVAVTPDGPAIVEGNNYSAHDYWQLPGQNPSKIGIMPTIRKYVHGM